MEPLPAIPEPATPLPPIAEVGEAESLLTETESLLEDQGPPHEVDPIDDLIIDSMVPDGGPSANDGNVDLDSPLEIQRQEPPDLTYEGTPLEGIEGTPFGEISSGLGAGSLDFPEDVIVSFQDNEIVLDVPPEAETSVDADAGMDEEEEVDASVLTDDLPMIEGEQSAGPTLADLEDRVLDDPENPDVHLAMADGLQTAGETDRVEEELQLALAGYEDREDWARAAQMADRLVELTPDSVTHHQKRVELAYRAGDRGPLLEAYLGLGDALSKSGALDKAIAVYGRVIEHDPKHARAAAALARLSPPPAKVETAPPPPRVEVPAAKTAAPAPKTAAPAPLPPKDAPPRPQTPAPAPAPKAPTPTPAPPPQPHAPTRPAAAGSGDFVDLRSMVFEDENRRDTRMRVNRREPEDQDEQREFHEILEQFKRGIDQNLESDDYEAHYDLGVAFKEMGLLDEAIAEFQKALRAPEGRLRTSEALGMAFFEKGQYAVCESILRRAVESVPGTDDSKIGLLYWMGRSAEALGKRRGCYHEL